MRSVTFISVLLISLSVFHHVHCQDIIFGNERHSSHPPRRHQGSYSPYSFSHPHSQFSYRRPRPHFYDNHGFGHHHSDSFHDDSFSADRKPPSSFGIHLPLVGNLDDVVKNPIGSLANGLQNLFGSLGGHKNEPPPTPDVAPTPPPRPLEQHHNHGHKPHGHGHKNSCKTMHGTPGVCVPLRDCDTIQKMLRGRSRSSASRILRQSTCPGGSYYEQRVCCGDAGTSGDQVEPDNPFGNLVMSSTTQSPPPPPPKPVPPPPPKPVPPPPKPIEDELGECGYKNEALSRIVGGRESAIGAWPWIAALGYRDPKSGKVNHLCGGALLTKSHVVTAAHCTHNRKDLVSIRLGDHDLFSSSDGVAPVEAPVARVIQNPDYNPTSFQNDIAIIKLKKPLDQYTSNIHPICLPLTPELRTSTFEGSSPFVAGWGSTQFNGPSSARLMEVQLPVVPLSQCQDKYKLFKNIKVDQSNICAGHERGGKDSCQGDSGGPLMQPIANKKYAIIGVVSFGYKCAEPGYPGVYTRVTSHLDWIQNTIRST